MIRNLPAYGTLVEVKFNRTGYTFNLTLCCPDMNNGLSIALLKTEPFSMFLSYKYSGNDGGLT